MKSIKIAGLCLVSMLMMSMALASAASAAPLWLLCLEGTNANNTKYEDSSCTKAKSTGKWESVALGSKSDTVRIMAFSLKLSDSATGVSVLCDGAGSEGWGLIETEKYGQIKVAKVANPSTNCATVAGATLCPTAKIEAVEGANLPWKTEVFEETEKLLTKIAKGTGAAGEPGWTVKCNGTTDTCTNPAGKEERVELSNLVSSSVLLVRGRFEERSKGNCTALSSTETGSVSGLIAILLWNGSGLSINKV